MTSSTVSSFNRCPSVCCQSVEEKEELELHCTQLKGDARVYRQRNKQVLRQLEEVIKERDKVRRRRR